MTGIRTLLVKCFVRKDGSTALEYALILGLMVIAIIAALTSVSAATGDSFGNSASELSQE